MKPAYIRVKPKKGAIVRHPADKGSKIMEPSGELVANNSFWRRRLRGGDVELVEAFVAQEPTILEKEDPKTKTKSGKGKE